MMSLAIWYPERLPRDDGARRGTGIAAFARAIVKRHACSALAAAACTRGCA